MTYLSENTATKVALTPRRSTETQTVSSIVFLSDQVAAQLCDDDVFMEEMTSRIYTRGLQLQLARLEKTQSSPFDAVYISSLEPDVVSQCAVNTLSELRSVTDLSASINFPED